MSAAASTPEHRAAGAGAPDSMDSLFAGYFRLEMPAVWPPPPIPVAARPTLANHRGGLPRSRLVLAASIASLLLGAWVVTGKLLGPQGPGASLNEGTATVPPEFRLKSGERPR